MSARLPAGPRNGAAGAVLVVVAVLALLALASAGITAAGRVSLSSTPLLPGLTSTGAIETLLALVGVVLAALTLRVFLGVRRAPRRSGEEPRGRNDLLTVAVGVVLAVLLGLAVRNGWLDVATLLNGADPAPVDPDAGDTPQRVPSSWTRATTAAVLALVLVAAAALVWWRAGLASMRAAAAGSGKHAEPAAEEVAAVDQALRAGRSALSAEMEPRTAVIACYAAMEAQLAGSGTTRGRAGTPEELLARTSAAGLVSPGPAATLTRLFGAARFSSHPLGSSERTAAEEALVRITSELADRVADRVAGAPGSGDSA